MTSYNSQYRWVLLLVGVLVLLRITMVPAYSQTPLPGTFTLYAPLVLNIHGGESPTPSDPYQIVFIDGAGAWLYGPSSQTATLLHADLPLTTTVRAAPNGRQVALALPDGWSLFAESGVPVAHQIAPGYQLDWDQNADQLLISRIGEGITRLTVATGQRLPLVRTTDETNDHSPFWSPDGTSLIFAHQEFGEQLYVTQIKPFELAQLPYDGENRTAAKLNPRLTLLAATTSWHDQPLHFHWSTDGQTLIFAARQQIHLLDLATAQTRTIEPPGFADTLANDAVDINADRILYAATGGLYITGLQGGTGALVISGENLHMPQWSPDGNQIIYTDASGVLYIAGSNGANIVTVANATPIGNFDILPPARAE